jgi:hypothetical protein
MAKQADFVLNMHVGLLLLGLEFYAPKVYDYYNTGLIDG